MNKEAILRVADAIESAELARYGVGFNMLEYFAYDGLFDDKTGHSCGTTACIAGWAYILLNEDGSPRTVPILEDSLVIPGHAEDALGLSPELSEDLFHPYAVAWDTITPARAARTLRHLAETGEVNWSA